MLSTSNIAHTNLEILPQSYLIIVKVRALFQLRKPRVPIENPHKLQLIPVTDIPEGYEPSYLFTFIFIPLLTPSTTASPTRLTRELLSNRVDIRLWPRSIGRRLSFFPLAVRQQMVRYTEKPLRGPERLPSSRIGIVADVLVCNNTGGH